ncbi:MAG: acyl-CoA dehydrogenase family protein [Alphaproteobacteria bacterium]|jgi:alkylation response protein AidB-like acyl-CoA dehydrogenase|nr:acyl-CoA dehydrogenase family protein [Alphaproteobacteria bacterium]MDP6815096.1 acyl-CoA dehydrogenase family protein [Alphaproteobacteria bacterium]
MDLELSDEQRLLVEQVRRFVRQEIEPLEAQMDPDASELPADDRLRLIELTTQMGLYNMDVPEEYGGSGLDLVTRTLLAMEMAQHRAGLYAPCFGVFGGMGLAQLYDANDDQKERYLFPVLRGEKSGFFALTEPSGGSDPARAIQTRAVRDGDDWLINGQKIFISGADKGDFGLVFARTDPEKGRAGVTCFIVDADSPGFHVRRVVHTLRSTHYATELQFEDLRVPPENILGEVDGGFGIANERLTRNRIPYAAGCLGVAIRAQEMAIEYVKIRETFGDLLATRQTVQNMIIDNELDIRTARWLTLAAADKAERGEPFRAEAAMAKIAATEAGGRVVDRAMQIHGGYGVTKEFPFERWYREMRIRRIGEGPNEVQRLIIARDLIGGSFH